MDLYQPGIGWQVVVASQVADLLLPLAVVLPLLGLGLEAVLVLGLGDVDRPVPCVPGLLHLVLVPGLPPGLCYPRSLNPENCLQPHFKSSKFSATFSCQNGPNT